SLTPCRLRPANVRDHHPRTTALSLHHSHPRTMIVALASYSCLARRGTLLSAPLIFLFLFFFFFFNDTATTEIYTLSLHDALPICPGKCRRVNGDSRILFQRRQRPDRKSTRLNSSHGSISYAVFCLKKKKK